MPVTHIVLLKLKPEVKESQIDSLYEAILALGKLHAVESVTAGENFSSRADGFTFSFVLVLNDLKGYTEDPAHVAFRDQVLKPLLASDPVVVDYEYPRATARHTLGREVATPELQRWDARHTNEDLDVQHSLLTAKGEASVWRTAVTARPIHGKGYADFVIEYNPKPTFRGIEIGIVGRGDLDKIEEAGKNFTHFETGFGWQCNGGFVTGRTMELPTIPHKEWAHDQTVGVYVDVEKGVVQFFLDRKKVGPTVHLPNMPKDVFFAVSINTGKAAVNGHFSASPPKVHIN